MTEEQFLQYKFKSESDSLDFKSEQYKFTSATDDQKSELLKDILAMANSWRSETGYIILGVIDTPEKPNQLIGIQDHVDDAQIQQFVNGKTNRVCTFGYQTITLDGLTFGVLEIPIQPRPVYLKKQYGKLKQETVYVRRGSSTTEAKLEEISLMGNANKKTRDLHPNLSLFFHNQTDFTTSNNLIADTYQITCSEEIPNYKSFNSNHFYSFNRDNSNYYREMLDYINFEKGYKQVLLSIENSGKIEAKNIEIDMKIDRCGFDVIIDGNEIKHPNKDTLLDIVSGAHNHKHFSEFEIQETNEHYLIKAHLDSLHAKRHIELCGSIYIKPIETSTLKMNIYIYCDGESQPFTQELIISFNHKNHTITSKQLIESF